MHQAIEQYFISRINEACGVPTDPEVQFQFYRCTSCRGLVTWKHIRAGACRCGNNRFSPAMLSMTEKLMAMIWPAYHARGLNGGH